MPCPDRRALGLALAIAAALAGPRPQSASAQNPGGAEGVFDDDAQAPAAIETPEVGDRESIGFTQENVAAQMTELEERMFRLSEALRSLEPENASRLRLALNFSREELILQQMKQTSALLREAQLSSAETEARELLAKLEHLRKLLVAEDLDFQMKLARLRQMRETLDQIDRIIKEERRELAWSRSASEGQATLSDLRDRRETLKALVEEQDAILQATRDGAPDGTRDREDEVREGASQLAADPSFDGLDPPFLKRSDPHLEDALTHLGAGHPDEAVPDESEALDLFRQELERLDQRIEETEQTIDPEQFEIFGRDQGRNREAASTLAAVSSRLGDSGIALQKGLIRAGASMRDAEGDLAETEAEPASEDQIEALKHLRPARDELGKAMESLLTELRTELQARIIGELSEMHDLQLAIREMTEAQAPRVAEGSRTARVLVAGLSRDEADLADRIGQLEALTVETEFGIALPTALRVLGREMRQVETWLAAGDPSEPTVALERRIEEDLLGLLEAMRRLPPTTPPPPGPLPTDLRSRERELNRLIAELKMIRLLQTRLNDDTVEVDQSRPDEPALPPDLRREIEALEDSQEELRDTISQLAERLQ